MAITIDTTKIGNRIKELKELKNLKQDDLIDLTGISRVTISNYEQGKVKPPVEFLMKLSHNYDVSMDWLCGLSDGFSRGKIKNLADVTDIILSLLDIDGTSIQKQKVDEWYVYSENEAGVPIREYPEEPNSILFSDIEIWNILKECKKMNDLYKQNTIDDEVYDLWKEKMIKKYKDILVNRNTGDGDNGND